MDGWMNGFLHGWIWMDGNTFLFLGAYPIINFHLLAPNTNDLRVY